MPECKGKLFQPKLIFAVRSCNVMAKFHVYINNNPDTVCETRFNPQKAPKQCPIDGV